MKLTFGSLFSGIGGFDLGLELAGMECRWQVEIDPFCQKVLAKHWPDVTRYGDIKAIDFTEVEPVDLICGGFPCQPVSVAGQRRGQDDERWLWPEFARAIRMVRPRYALMENVPGLLGLGMGDVLGDLAELGYDAEWQSIPAAAVGAPHLRWRVWIVAHAASTVADTDSDGRHIKSNVETRSERAACGPAKPLSEQWANTRFGVVGNTDGQRQQEQRSAKPIRAELARPECSSWWAVEPAVGRVADGVPLRVDRLRSLGNAIVPQVAEWIGQRIVEAAA